MIHGHAIGGVPAKATIGLIAIAASTPAAMNGTVTLSSIPSGSDSAMALDEHGRGDGDILRRAENARDRERRRAAEHHERRRSRPTTWRGSTAAAPAACGWPITVENPSPNASSTHATAAISRCQLKHDDQHRDRERIEDDADVPSALVRAKRRGRRCGGSSSQLPMIAATPISAA